MTVDVNQPADESIDEPILRHIGYEPGFDGIRGVGAVLAVVAHATMIILPSSGDMGLPTLVPGTFVFMDAFYVLSGFLITALLLKEQHKTGKISLKAFYRRRILRLLPALWLLLVVHYMYARVSNYDMEIERESIISIFTFSLNFRMDNILTARVSPGLTQMWSFSIEEQFYLIWPLIVILLLPLTRKLRTTSIVLITAIIIIGLNRFRLWSNGESWLRIYTHTDTRADSLFLGCLLGYFWVFDKYPRKYLPQFAWAATAFLGWAIVKFQPSDAFASIGGYNILAFSWAVILLATLEGKWILGRVMSSRFFRFLGTMSYGIYLWHVPIFFAVAERGEHLSSLVRLILALGIIAFAVYFSWTFVEKPFVQWKDRLENKPDIRRQGGSTVVPREIVPVALDGADTPATRSKQ